MHIVGSNEKYRAAAFCVLDEIEMSKNLFAERDLSDLLIVGSNEKCRAAAFCVLDEIEMSKNLFWYLCFSGLMSFVIVRYGFTWLRLFRREF